jgi:hypothetical protein
MADLSDVQSALAQLAQAALYPDGVRTFTQPSPVAGAPVIIYPGWPDPATLDRDLAAGKVHVSIFTRPEERNTTRFPTQWQELSNPMPSASAIVAGSTVTFAGSVVPPLNFAVIVNGNAYLYAAQAGDDLTRVCNALLGEIDNDIPGTKASGASITLGPSAHQIQARVGAVGQSIKEVRRQERLFQLSVWANTPALRSGVAGALDVYLAGLERFVLPDQSLARLIYKGSPVLDDAQKENVYRRDLLYTVEYATTAVRSDAQIVIEQINVSGRRDGATSATPITTVII